VTEAATAERFYQQFKWSVIAPIEADRWALDAGDVLDWLESVASGTAGVVRVAEETSVAAGCWVRHLPAVFPERRETVARECLGCQTHFAVGVRLPLPAVCPDCGGDVLAQGGLRGSGAAGPAAVQRAADPEDETMTLRFIVARILRGLIELAERDADAELVDTLHDALDVASSAGGLDA